MDRKPQLPGTRGLKIAIVSGLTLLTASTLFAQNAVQTDLDALKLRMDQMQKQYEQRIEKTDQERAQDRERMNQERMQDKQQISELQAEIRALQSKAASNSSILNTRVLTDANGTEAPGKAPAAILDQSFLQSLTRNFSFTVYLRAGFQFNGSGGGGNFNFEVPDNPGGRFRLGNENDLYMELSWNQFHLLGDSPDVADASFRVTPFFQNNVTRITFDSLENQTKDFNVGMREAFVEMKNVFKSAPDITFWAGQRFYDR